MKKETNLNQTLNILFNRKSVRNYSKKEIKKKELDLILKAAIRAANSGNRQVYSIIVVDDKELLKKYFFGGNKALVFLVDFNRWFDLARHLGYEIEESVDGMRGFTISSMDAILAAQSAAIAAKSLGIGSLFTTKLHREDMNKVYEFLGLPEKYCFPYLSLCLGYPDEQSKLLKGRVKKGVIHYGKYQSLSQEELDEQIAEYDNEANHLGLINEQQRKEEGFDHYLSFYFANWSKSQPKQEIENFYNTLQRSELFKAKKFLNLN
ncbi:MAG: nitroreductase family protein [Candidatus Lokiarchaeota archaeon]|nr:nitroreductase family protein [Candidatus Lokiarchaeota archaeon]